MEFGNSKLLKNLCLVCCFFHWEALPIRVITIISLGTWLNNFDNPLVPFLSAGALIATPNFCLLNDKANFTREEMYGVKKMSSSYLRKLMKTNHFKILLMKDDGNFKIYWLKNCTVVDFFCT